MTHPEFLLSTRVVFRTVQHGGTHLQASWRLVRTFSEFQVLDSQLRHAFPEQMKPVAPPPPHRRRTWLRRHCHATFLAKRCAELNVYLKQLLSIQHLNLTRFHNPQASLVLRCFCNFDAALITANVTLVPNQWEHCILNLETRDDGCKTGKYNTIDSSVYSELEKVEEGDEGKNESDNREQLIQARRQHRRTEKDASETQLDALESNLMDDKTREFVLCTKYECACRVSPFRVTYKQMTQLLRLRGYEVGYAPPESALTALYCILSKLQQYNDLDKRLYDAMTGTGQEISDTVMNDNLQLAQGVDLLRQTLANYGLLYVQYLERHFRTPAVDLKKRLHEFKSRRQARVGAVELVLLATMLNLSIRLITNDHEGSEQQIVPLPGLRSIREGERIDVTCGYMMPTLVCVHGYYLLAEGAEKEEEKEDETERRRMWQGLDELDRRLMAEIEHAMTSGSDVVDLAFDFDVAESLNAAILDAVWEDCAQNPNLFHLFHHQARMFGKGRTTARSFMQYLEVAFGFEGASYLVDFLLHVLPEEELRKQLLQARWMRLHRQLTKRLSPGVS
ncbi:hypothetical protein PsorP6_003239 [Peronosclerospora sorghi]|uniref:Uncharacterized protein n=1 Tax=Peronosclerospora sorghi TaxID=230839 RepID=A0ACC0VQL9_9STRA|nr:hypothetical protein PsorP6_003239 [Peronosclerospora sorghi]